MRRRLCSRIAVAQQAETAAQQAETAAHMNLEGRLRDKGVKGDAKGGAKGGGSGAY